MNEKVRYESHSIRMAVERKLISKEQYEQCRELVRKSKRIGLDSSIDEVLIKQGLITREQLDELDEITQLGEGGELFGGYRLQKLLGQGGMGKVYEAVHEFTCRKVALKILKTTFTKDTVNVTRFFQEVRALAKLTHSHIVTLFDAGKAGRRYFFAMELIDGPSLAQHVESNGRLAEHEALRITKAVAQALSHAHRASVVHRDIKPENIILDQNFKPKVTDFGVVMHCDDDHLTLTQEGFMVGSVHFASPEQVDSKRDIDGRTDIYSLGATLYYMLTGRTVYTGNCAEEVLTKQIMGTWTSPKKYNPLISNRTVRLIRKMMARNRDKRLQTMDSVILAIDSPRTCMRITRIAITAGAGLLLFVAGLLAESFFGLSAFLFQ